MKKKFVFIIIVILILFGFIYFKCSNNKKDKKDVYIKVEEKNQQVYKDNKKEEYGLKIDDNTNDITKNFIKEDEKFRSFHVVNKEKAFIATEGSISNKDSKTINLRLLNLLSGKIEKEVSIKKEKELYNISYLNKGFYIVESNRSSQSRETFFYIYDENLNLVKKLDVSSIENKVHNTPELSNSGNKLAYIGTKGKYSTIYISDLDLSNEKKVCEVEYPNKDKLSAIEAIRFMDGDEKIAFRGSIFRNENFSPKAFGTVDIKDGVINYNEHDGLCNIINISKGKTLFFDASTERGKSSSGKIFLVHNDSNKVDEFELKDKDESQTANISDNGNFIGTILKGKSKKDEPIYRFRIYDTKNKAIAKEFDSTFQDKSYFESMIREFQICEDNNKVYVVYTLGKETKIYEYRLNK